MDTNANAPKWSRQSFLVELFLLSTIYIFKWKEATEKALFGSIYDTFASRSCRIIWNKLCPSLTFRSLLLQKKRMLLQCSFVTFNFEKLTVKQTTSNESLMYFLISFFHTFISHDAFLSFAISFQAASSRPWILGFTVFRPVFRTYLFWTDSELSVLRSFRVRRRTNFAAVWNK